MMAHDDTFDKMVRALEIRFGEENAITIDELAIISGLFKWEKNEVGMLIQSPRRRMAEHTLETRFDDFPFLVISSTKSGYFRPVTPDEVEHWWKTCHGRIKAIALRMHTGRQKAARSGFRYCGNGKFSQVPVNDLFENNQQQKGVCHVV
jgi:hypothetical protein